MKPKTFLLFFLCALFIGKQIASAQNIYSHAYGDRKNPAIIYIHGGPRGNATLFEGTTAKALASKGYYVIVYDRRGEGRSADANAKMTFDEAISDLNHLIEQYGVRKVSILGHSFGGIVSTLYTNSFPEKVERLILVGALFSQQETYDHILNTSQKIATQGKDTATLRKIDNIKSLDKNSAEYRKQTYEVASHFDFFKMPNKTEESKEVAQEYENTFAGSNIRNDNAPVLFYKNESRVNIDTKPVLNKIKNKGVKLSAIYGRQDGIFSKKQLSDLRKITGPSDFYMIENCSHYPFADQRALFLQTVQEIMSK